MIHADRTTQALAVGAAVVAGFVDAVGFIETSGYFVSFMTGNSTRLGIGLAGPGDTLLPAALVLAFVVGVICGSLVVISNGLRSVAIVYGCVAGFLVVSAGVSSLGFATAAALLMAFSMGSMNTAFQANGEVRIGLTYMTGTLVKTGQRVAGAIKGGPRWAWLPYLLQWLGLVTGVAMGAAAHSKLGGQALWLAAAVLVGLCVFSAHRTAR